jgi:heme A synthase
MIALAAWWNISHGAVMAIQMVEAWIHSVHRNFTDVIVFLVIGVVLLALLPAKREAVAPGVARTDLFRDRNSGLRRCRRKGLGGRAVKFAAIGKRSPY